jgi:hypothetical protein
MHRNSKLALPLSLPANDADISIEGDEISPLPELKLARLRKWLSNPLAEIIWLFMQLLSKREVPLPFPLPGALPGMLLPAADYTLREQAAYLIGGPK